MKLDKKEYEAKMLKSIDAYKKELETIRVGRANPNVLNNITVDYWGVPTQISQVGTVSVPDARTIVITPWEANMVKAVEKAINMSDLGINPQNDGKNIRLVFPPLNEERRKELQKKISALGENAKVAVRNIRRDALDACKKLKSGNLMTEDEQKASEKEIQDLTDSYVKKLDEVTSSKQKDIMDF